MTEGKTGWIDNWYLCLIPAQGGSPRNITRKFDEFMFSPQWSQDGRRVIFQSPKGLGNQLYSVSLESEEIRPLVGGDFVWSGFSFSASENLMAFIGSDPSTPPEVFVSKPDKFNPVRLTFTNPQLKELTLGRQEMVHWKSPDGLEMEGLLLLPVGFVEGKPAPLLTYVHGGPSGRFIRSFSPQSGRLIRCRPKATPCKSWPVSDTPSSCRIPGAATAMVKNSGWPTSRTGGAAISGTLCPASTS